MKKMILGGAQIGMNYGVTNSSGAISEKSLANILHRCLTLNILDIDTASGYVDSEKKLGEFFHGNDYGFKVHTKLPPSIDCDVSKWVNLSLDTSLSKLSLSSVETLYVHNPQHLIFGDKYLIYRSLLEAKKSGKTKNIGVSVYHREELDLILSDFNIDVVQLPVNIFDRRFLADRYLESLKSRNIKIFVRSIFLQGLLLNNNIVSSYFSKWDKLFNKYYNFLNENNYSPLEFCINFISNIKSIDGVIFGATNIDELDQILHSRNSTKVFKNFEYFTDDLDLLIPSNWKL